MNSDVYINQVLKDLGLLFFEKCIQKKEHMIWMDNGAGYHISKTTTKWKQQMDLICINWPAQPPDLNTIENF